MFDMGMMPEAARFDVGYNAGRIACLTAGSSDEVRARLAEMVTDKAFRTGWEWAIFDYDDANGLPALTIQYLSRRTVG